MALAFRAKAEVGPGVAANTVVSKPTGTVDGDIMIAAIAVEDDVAVTAPAGWTLITSIDNTNQPFDLYVYWKRASSEGASYTWTHASSGRSGVIASYSGGIASGDPQDVTATTNQANNASLVGTGVTINTAGSMLILVGGQWLWSNSVSVGASGMTERVDNTNTSLFDELRASTGATGNKTITISGSEDWVSIMLAIKPAADVTTTKTITGKSRIQKSVTQTITGKARIRATATKTITGKSRIQKAVPQTITGKSRIRKSVLQTITGKARIRATTTKTQTGKSRITAVTTKTQQGRSRITAATSRTQTGKSRITAATTKTQTGKSRIRKSVNQTITGKANINAASTRTITGKGRITVSTNHTQLGRARIATYVLRTITGKANIAGTTTRTITGKARIQRSSPDNHSTTYLPISTQATILNIGQAGNTVLRMHSDRV